MRKLFVKGDMLPAIVAGAKELGLPITWENVHAMPDLEGGYQVDLPENIADVEIFQLGLRTNGYIFTAELKNFLSKKGQ